MNTVSLIKQGLAVAVLWAATNMAFAVTCNYKNGIQPPVGAMPLQVAAITVGRDVPVGTKVFRQIFRVASGKSVIAECFYAPYTAQFGWTLEGTGGTSSWGTGPYANKVYLTSIPGLGVTFTARGDVLPYFSGISAPASCPRGQSCTIDFYSLTEFELTLIKVGDVKPGVLRGDLLPTVAVYATVDTTIKMMGYKMGFSGNIQVVARTCDTPDVSVAMGKIKAKTFTGANSASDWTDFAIRLNNCPAFNGMVSKTPIVWESQSGNSPSGKATSLSVDNNNLRYRIDPVRAAINSGTGVLGIDPTAAGRPAAASGLGLQIATVTGTLPLATMQSSGLTLNASDSSSYTIPLRARYLQTGSKLTPGPANASATFTISYE